MDGYRQRLEEVLSPFVGKMVADTCIRATAVKLGKTADTLGPADIDALSENVRRLLTPIAPASGVEAVVSRLREVV